MVPALLVLNAAVFALQMVYEAIAPSFALTVEGLEHGAWWQLLTYSFLHGNLWHLLVNLLALWFAGRPVERVMGPWRFLGLYVLSAIGGGIMQLVLGPRDIMLLGASGSVFGVLVAFSTLFADREVIVLVFFVLPLRLRACRLGQGLVLLTVVAMLAGFQPWIGHAAHLGGAIVGYLATRASGFGHPTFLERLLDRR